MKHSINVTLLLISLFLLSHFVGFVVIKHYLPEGQELPLGIQKPQFEERTSYIPIFITILVATIIALILIKLEALRVWKLWFLLSIFLTLAIAFAAFLPNLIAIVLAIIFALLKTFRPNPIIHNFTEVFVYGGLAAIFVPVLGILSISILLVLISVYDMIAVWKTKHMISMAKFQTKSKIFAGLFIPYGAQLKKQVNNTNRVIKTEYRQAILGGGDIAFPLLFSGVILKTMGIFPAIITSLTAALALTILFIMADKKKFYPAMPFISVGCFVGYVIVLLAF